MNTGALHRGDLGFCIFVDASGFIAQNESAPHRLDHEQCKQRGEKPANPLLHYILIGAARGFKTTTYGPYDTAPGKNVRAGTIVLPRAQ